MSKKRESEQPMDLTEESVGDTDSVSSEDSYSVLSQSTAKLDLPVKLTRENARQDFVAVECSPSKTVEWSVAEVKEWALKIFGSQNVADKFEQEEIDGRVLLSTTVQSSEAMDKLGLDTIGKKGKFVEKINELSGRPSTGGGCEQYKPTSRTDFSLVDRILTNTEKNQMNTADQAIYNTKKKKITNYIKQVWPLGSPAPRFRNNPDATKKMHAVVDKLAKDVEFTLPRLGLGRNAIMQIIRKHMDERRRRESEELDVPGMPSPASSSESDTSSYVSGDSPESDEAKPNKLEDYYNTGLTLSSAESIILVWLDRATINDVHLIKDLKPLAKEFNMKLLRNKEKNAHIRAIASILLNKGKIKVTAPLESITRDDVQILGK